MPENPPPSHDPFADLYGRLPDPRRASAAPSSDAPSSRRAAREARRTQTDPNPQVTSADASTAASTPQPADAARSERDQRPTQAEPMSSVSRPAPTPHAATSAAAESASLPPSASAPRAVRGESSIGGAASVPGTPAEGSLEDLFAGRASTDHVGAPAPRPSKRRRRTGAWIALAIVLVLIGGVATGGVMLWNTYGPRIQTFFGGGEPSDYEAGMATGEARVSIVAGDTGESVSPKLFEAGVTKTPNALYTYLVDSGIGFTFQPGVYKLQQQMTSAAVLQALQNPDNRLDSSVQLREGLTLPQSLEAISEQAGIPLADLQTASADPSAYGVSASTLEGWIFPATYDFDDGVSATDVIKKMVDRTVQSLDAAGVPAEDRERILTIASIVEREARKADDFYKVSRVIENRLQPDNQETHGLLQMDSTAQYGAGEIGNGSSSSSENALTNDNPYNTYIHPGLPIGPIANPGDQAIDAAMHPVDGPWYYFTTVNLETGETVFSTTYDEQLAAVAQFQQWCKENPEGGC